MRDDRALERRALRKVFYVWRDSVKDEPEDVGIAFVAAADDVEAALESHDVRIGREVFGQLRIEQPRVADTKTRRCLGEVAREEWLRARE